MRKFRASVRPTKLVIGIQKTQTLNAIANTPQKRRLDGGT